MHTTSAPRPTHDDEPRLAPNLVRWGAVFAGTVISLGIFALISSLWLGIAYTDADSSGWISGNLAWFLAGTAVFALLVAGFLAGYLSGVRGATSGMINGLTAWGLLFVASLVTVIPGLTAVTSRLGAGIAGGSNTIGGPLGQAGGGVTAESAVWATFWSLLIGAVVAALGGVAGGAAKRHAKTAKADVRGTEDEHYTYPEEPVTSVHTERVDARHAAPGAATVIRPTGTTRD
jgi:hypothetical protein